MKTGSIVIGGVLAIISTVALAQDATTRGGATSAAPSTQQNSPNTGPTTNPGANTNVDARSSGAMLSPEQRTTIKRYVVEQHMQPTYRDRVAIGATLPGNIELQVVPNDWGPSVTHYRYVYGGNGVVLVDPSTRRVVQVIE
jgi:hypothetical protein